MLKLFKYLKPKHYFIMLFIVGLVVLQVLLDLELPEYMTKIINQIMLGGTTKEILNVGFKMLLIAFLSMFCTIVVGYLSARVGSSFSFILREKVYDKVNDFSLEEINNFSNASLITRTTNDINQVQQVIVMALKLFITAPVMAVCAIIKILNRSSTLSLATATAVVILLMVLITIFLIVMPKFKLIQKQTDNLNRVTRENLTGLRVVKAYNADENIENKFDKINAYSTKLNLFTARCLQLINPFMNMVMSGLGLTIVWLGAYLINNNSLNIADMMAFSQYSMQVLISFVMLTMMLIMLPRASVSAKRINEVLSTKIKIKDGEFKIVNENQKIGEIEFKNVNFKYPDADDYILKDINLKINKGETVAFIGSTGSGKSTLINLIPRFYDVSSGEVLVDGINVKDYKLSELNNKLGYIPQQGVLFSGTIKSNLLYGFEEGTEEDIKKALKISEAYDFVYRKDKNIDSEITQGGSNVSGGQRQRLSIARAIIKKPEILIFDDSFSALDYKTDKKLRKNLKKMTDNITTIIVAQRINTIKNADKIIVLNNGEIVGQGNHKELLENCDVYKEIAFSQLSKEELENE